MGHKTSFNQSECIISEQSNLNVFIDIKSRSVWEGENSMQRLFDNWFWVLQNLQRP